MNWCILIPLIVGALCALLGYLLGRLFRGSNTNDGNNDKIAKLETDLAACMASKKASATSSSMSASTKAATTTSASLAANAAPEVSTFDADAAKAVFGKKIKDNDLTVVEGIGPKIKQLLIDGGIPTFAALAAAPYDQVKGILTAAGSRYQMHDPTTWGQQAQMAADGKWDELKKWQDEHTGGRAK